MISVDKDLMQRKLLINSFLSCSGFKVFLEELEDRKNAVQVKIDNHERSPEDSLAGHNFRIGRKTGIQDVLDIIDGFREELEESLESVNLSVEE